MKEKDNEMGKTCSSPLKANPFTTYRDPKTGRWVVVTNDTKNQKSSTQLNSQAQAIKYEI